MTPTLWRLKRELAARDAQLAMMGEMERVMADLRMQATLTPTLTLTLAYTLWLGSNLVVSHRLEGGVGSGIRIAVGVDS